jgi:hypothetical protein
VGADGAVVNIGITHDTAEFAVESIRRWWKLDGRRRHRGANALLICADAGEATAAGRAGGSCICRNWPTR